MSTLRALAVKPVFRSGTTGRLAGIDVRQLGLPLAVGGLVLYFSIASPFFFSASNFENISRQGAALAAIAVGQTFVLLTAGIDLSVGATVGLVSVTTAWAAVQWGVPAGIAFGIAVGTSVGLFNGFVVTKLRVAPFVATLAMLSIASAIALILSGGIPVRNLPEDLTYLARAEVIGLPLAVVVSALLFLVAFVLLRWTRLGRYLYAVGGNAEATRLAGINVTLVTISAYALCSTFVAIGAVFLTARVYQGQPTLGEALTLQSIAAAVLGGVSLFGGRGSVVGVAFGVVFISVLANGLNLLNVPSFTQMLVVGAALIAAVALDSFLAGRRGDRLQRRRFLGPSFGRAESAEEGGKDAGLKG